MELNDLYLYSQKIQYPIQKQFLQEKNLYFYIQEELLIAIQKYYKIPLDVMTYKQQIQHLNNKDYHPYIFDLSKTLLI